MKDWISYYDSAHSIYVNARHHDVHYARLADDIVAYVPSASAAVLDYGRRTLNLGRIVAIVNSDNHSSIAVLEKIGLRFERMMRLAENGPELKLFAPAPQNLT